MKIPKQSPPVKRFDLIQPHETVDVVHGNVDELVNIRMRLMHGANYNDPAAYQHRTYRQLQSSGWGGCLSAFAAYF